MTKTKQRVRHIISGDKGWLEEDPDEPGKPAVRMDRGGAVEYRRYRKGDWPPDKDHHPLSAYQFASIAFSADAEFMRTQSHGDAKDWHALDDATRIKWIEKGPSNDPVRRRMYKALRKALAPLMA